MKYTLLKKWHPSQVEEVGHVFDPDIFNCLHYEVEVPKTTNYYQKVEPHEIALLVDAGYLEKQENECKCTQWANVHAKFCPLFESNFDIHSTTLDLWTEMPTEDTLYWYVSDIGTVNSNRFINDYSARWNTFRLKTNNCHKTKASAEEALKRLLEK